jgi:nucleotide-binding universal stress UspA family protein
VTDGAPARSSRRPILVCYDGSPEATRAVSAAAGLFAGRPAVVLFVSSPVAVERVRTTSVTAVRDELLEEVRAAARREAEAMAAEGAAIARQAGLEARPLVIQAEARVADAIVRVAIDQSAAAVVVGRPSRARRSLRPGRVARGVVDDCPLPVVLV